MVRDGVVEKDREEGECWRRRVLIPRSAGVQNVQRALLKRLRQREKEERTNSVTDEKGKTIAEQDSENPWIVDEQDPDDVWMELDSPPE
jgi:hypothetical protein